MVQAGSNRLSGPNRNVRFSPIEKCPHQRFKWFDLFVTGIDRRAIALKWLDFQLLSALMIFRAMHKSRRDHYGTEAWVAGGAFFDA
jgi:hypothetical protein